MPGILSPNPRACFGELIEEEKSVESEETEPEREREEREHRNGGERELNDDMEWPLVIFVAIGAGKSEVRCERDGDCEDEEDEAGEGSAIWIGLIVYANPFQEGF